MPSLRGLIVHVTDRKGNDFAEWGVQSLTQHAQGPKVSAYIQSTTGAQFCVSVQPRLPFFSTDYPNSEAAQSGKSKKRQRRRRNSKCRHESLSGPHSGSEIHTETHGEKPDHVKGCHSSPVRDSGMSPRPPEFSFLATLYLDGRSSPERRIIIYLDPDDSDFKAPDGKVLFKHRWVQSKSGNITEHAWVFRETSIEAVFDRLLINGEIASSKESDEDAIIEGMRSAGLSNEGDFGCGNSKMGQIVVEVRRVTLGVKTYDQNYLAKHKEGEDEDVDMKGVKHDITHTTGLTHRKTLAPKPHRVVDYYEYRPGEGNWATFQFFYRSEEQLRRFGFGDFQQMQKTVRPEHVLNTYMANLTPLSIANQVLPKRQEPKQGDTYEEKVQSKIFRSGKDRASGSDHQDAPANDGLETATTFDYPPTALPLTVPRTPKLGPKRDSSVPGISSLDSTIASAVTTAAMTLKRFPVAESKITSNAENLACSNLATTDTAPYVSRHNHHLQPKPYPDTDETHTAFPPKETPIHAMERASPLNTFEKRNVAKLDNVSGKDYRHSPMASFNDSDRDDEEADDELNTESDLESHVDEDDFDHIANPKGSEMDKSYESLNSRFKDIEIKKRSFSDIRDVEADPDNVGHKNSPAFANDVYKQGEKIPGLSLALEEEVGRVPQGKKVKTEGDAHPAELGVGTT